MSKENEQIGYKRPPLETRFQLGKSGNPSGRPKRPPSIHAGLLAELGKMVGSKTKQETMVDLATDGNLRAMSTVVQIAARAPEEEADNPEVTPEEQEILEAFASRQVPDAAKKPPDDGGQ
jgi:Family of unknown function (DUF5681)